MCVNSISFADCLLLCMFCVVDCRTQPRPVRLNVSAELERSEAQIRAQLKADMSMSSQRPVSPTPNRLGSATLPSPADPSLLIRPPSANRHARGAVDQAGAVASKSSNIRGARRAVGRVVGAKSSQPNGGKRRKSDRKSGQEHLQQQTVATARADTRRHPQWHDGHHAADRSTMGLTDPGNGWAASAVSLAVSQSLERANAARSAQRSVQQQEPHRHAQLHDARHFSQVTPAGAGHPLTSTQTLSGQVARPGLASNDRSVGSRSNNKIQNQDVSSPRSLFGKNRRGAIGSTQRPSTERRGRRQLRSPVSLSKSSAVATQPQNSITVAPAGSEEGEVPRQLFSSPTRPAVLTATDDDSRGRQHDKQHDGVIHDGGMYVVPAHPGNIGKYDHLAGTNPFDADGADVPSEADQEHAEQHRDAINPASSLSSGDHTDNDGSGPAPTSSWAGSGIAEEELSMSPVDPSNWNSSAQMSPNRPLTPGRRPVTPGRVSFGRTRQVYMYRESPKERAQKLAAAAPALAKADQIRAENERLEEEDARRVSSTTTSGGAVNHAAQVDGATDPGSATSAALLSALVAAKSEMLSALDPSPARDGNDDAHEHDDMDDYESPGSTGQSDVLTQHDTMAFFSGGPSASVSRSDPNNDQDYPRDISDNSEDDHSEGEEEDAESGTRVALRAQIDRMMGAVR
jgi:hypothetical protein